METEKYSIGTLAYLDSFNGLIPCKVTAIKHDRDYGHTTVTAIVTASRKAYPKGIEVCTTARHIVPRKHVYVRNGQYRINTLYQWE